MTFSTLPYSNLIQSRMFHPFGFATGCDSHIHLDTDIQWESYAGVDHLRRAGVFLDGVVCTTGIFSVDAGS